MSRREALQQASATRCKRSQKAVRACAQGHHVYVVGFGGLSDMLGKKLRWERMRKLPSEQASVPTSLTVTGLACRTFAPQRRQSCLTTTVNCVWGSFARMWMNIDGITCAKDSYTIPRPPPPR